MLDKKSAGQLAVSVLALAVVMPAAMSQTLVSRTVISAKRVADAMASAGILVQPDQVELLSGVSTAGEGARMRVVSAFHRAGGTVKVKLRCRNNDECLPFYALIHGLDGDVARPKIAAAPAVAASLPKDVIRGGDHAILILETSDSRMRFPVICLQSGVLGQRVRAASPDRKQFYEAEVVAAGLLKGKL